MIVGVAGAAGKIKPKSKRKVQPRARRTGGGRVRMGGVKPAAVSRAKRRGRKRSASKVGALAGRMRGY